MDVYYEKILHNPLITANSHTITAPQTLQIIPYPQFDLLESLQYFLNPVFRPVPLLKFQ